MGKRKEEVVRHIIHVLFRSGKWAEPRATTWTLRGDGPSAVTAMVTVRAIARPSISVSLTSTSPKTRHLIVYAGDSTAVRQMDLSLKIHKAGNAST